MELDPKLTGAEMPPEEAGNELPEDMIPGQDAARDPASAYEEKVGAEEFAQQMEALRRFDPQAPQDDALFEGEKGEALLACALRTGTLLDAYKLTWFDELQARQAELGRRAAEQRMQEKAHLRRTQTHGIDGPPVTRQMLEAYRVFDPEITQAEVRRYEARDAARRQNTR